MYQQLAGITVPLPEATSDDKASSVAPAEEE
jgi:hypothetical protein